MGFYMNFDEIMSIADYKVRLSRIYEYFNEKKRLNHSKAARIEFLTNVRYIEIYLKPGAKILDIGAGCGEYSLYFAGNGYDVTAIELAERNYETLKSSVMPGYDLKVFNANALDLSMLKDASFDIVLVMGPLYHLAAEEDQLKCIKEARRVCKKDGKLFFAFISNDMVMMTEFANDNDYLIGDTYEHDTFKVKDFPFVFMTVDGMRGILQKAGLHSLHEVASDGLSELMVDNINQLSEEGYARYIDYHMYACEKPELLGYSNHILIVCDNA